MADTLADLLRRLRLATNRSGDPNLGRAERDSLIDILQRTQRQLWEDHDWRFLLVDKTIALKTGQRYYDVSGIDLKRVNSVHIKHEGTWTREPIAFGIGPEQYNEHDSEATAAEGSFTIASGGAGDTIASVTVDGIDILGAAVSWDTDTVTTAAAVATQINTYTTIPEYTAAAEANKVVIKAAETAGALANDLTVAVTVTGSLTTAAVTDMAGGADAETDDPVCRWDIVDIDGEPKIEVWPAPESNDQKMRVNGPRALSDFVSDGDLATLDGDLIVLFAAAELLAKRDPEAASVKAQLAGQRLQTLKGHWAKAQPYVYGGARGRPRPDRARYRLPDSV